MSGPQFFVCPTCSAYGAGTPPHGWLHPCPLAVKEIEARVASLDAQRMSSIRHAGGIEGMAEAMRRLTGGEDEAA